MECDGRGGDDDLGDFVLREGEFLRTNALPRTVHVELGIIQHIAFQDEVPSYFLGRSKQQDDSKTAQQVHGQIEHLQIVDFEWNQGKRAYKHQQGSSVLHPTWFLRDHKAF